MRKTGFEHTLWDLKLWGFFVFVWKIISLNIPYGIWNMYCFALCSACIPRLNIPYGIWNSILEVKNECWRACLNIPYGIWNQIGYRGYITILGLNIPYGIWNGILQHIWGSSTLVWTYPMGFETRKTWIRQTQNRVWTYPMGFETRGEGQLRHTQSPVWTYPMGFETCL